MSGTSDSQKATCGGGPVPAPILLDFEIPAQAELLLMTCLAYLSFKRLHAEEVLFLLQLCLTSKIRRTQSFCS